MVKGYFCPVLHAHLPFVRHSEKGEIAEEWLYEGITETYIPLLNVMNKLLKEGIDFRLTLSISPTLTEMLSDKLLQERYKKYLKKSIELSEKELKRTRLDPKKNKLAELYQYLLKETYYIFHKKYNDNLLTGFKKIAETGKLELITTAATHGYLPLFLTEEAVEAQIKVGRETFYRHFGKYPKGFWLPECGFKPEIEKNLINNNIKYSFISSQGLLHSRPRPGYGLYAPLISPGGTAFFGRDRESSKQVWSADEGYPGDYNYREFYRDIGYELDYEYLKPYLPQGIRKDTGFKYYKITSRTEKKELYDHRKARKKAAEHADDFLHKRKSEYFYLNKILDRPPLTVSPYDAELFGHWWFEGPAWFEFLFRKLDNSYPEIKAITPSEYLKLYPENQKALPAESSWGYKGYHDVWLNGKNDWIYRHLHEAELLMRDFAERYSDLQNEPLVIKGLNQMARELLLAQSSDWAFIMKTETMDEYAEERTKKHLNNFFTLAKAVNEKKGEELFLIKEKEEDIFPFLDYKIYCPAEKSSLRKEG